jgi:transcription elongation GreA/GreB family factor
LPAVDKPSLIAAIAAQLEAQLQTLVRSVQSARENATHEESKPENEYDTRGLEASYLAGAQAARAEQLRLELGQLRELPTRAWKKGEPAAPGALVELEDEDGKKGQYLLALCRGMNLQVAGKAVVVVNVASPMGRELLGKREGDDLEVEVRGEARGYGVRAVR